jgi:hypothetical protein
MSNRRDMIVVVLMSQLLANMTCTCQIFSCALSYKTATCLLSSRIAENGNERKLDFLAIFFVPFLLHIHHARSDTHKSVWMKESKRGLVCIKHAEKIFIFTWKNAMTMATMPTTCNLRTKSVWIAFEQPWLHHKSGLCFLQWQQQQQR